MTQNADDVRVEVLATDLYLLTRFYYGTAGKVSSRTAEAADRCAIALYGTPGADAAARLLNDGEVCE